MIQTIVLASLVAVAGLGAYQALGSATSDGADCAGDAVEALAAVPCKDGKTLTASVSTPPPAPEPPRTDGGEGGGGDAGDGPEVDLGKELLDLLLDITGLNDIKDCVLEGDPLACVMAIAGASPIKGIAIAVKLAKNAKRIKNLIDRLLAARKAKKAKEAEDKAKDADNCKVGPGAQPVAATATAAAAAPAPGGGCKPKKDKKAEKIEKCEDIHDAYKNGVPQAFGMPGGCRRCDPSDSPQLRQAKMQCLREVHKGRMEYLKAGCDFVLPGSVNSPEGSAGKEAGHRRQADDVVRMLRRCL